MPSVLVLGAGKIGGAIVDLLDDSGDYTVTVADQSEEFLALIPGERAKTVPVDVADPASLAAAADGYDYIISALPFFLNPAVARVARQVGAHYFDLTEDIATTRAVREVADGAATAFVPQCGLAPGFISITAYDLAKRFDRLRDVRMRVGALPQFPVDTLKYNLTWSTDGLINEYCNPCESIRDGRVTEVLPLEGLESFSLDGVDYEAFNTSGGLGTLAETLEGQVDRLEYKTVRYPGHCDVMKMLLEDLRLKDRRDLLKDVLESSVPITHQDVVLIFVTVSGWRESRLTQETYAKKIYAKDVAGRLMSAIQITTAAGVCAMVDLHASGQLPASDFVRQEDATPRCLPDQPVWLPVRLAADTSVRPEEGGESPALLACELLPRDPRNAGHPGDAHACRCGHCPRICGRHRCPVRQLSTRRTTNAHHDLRPGLTCELSLTTFPSCPKRHPHERPPPSGAKRSSKRRLPSLPRVAMRAGQPMRSPAAPASHSRISSDCSAQRRSSSSPLSSDAWPTSMNVSSPRRKASAAPPLSARWDRVTRR